MAMRLRLGARAADSRAGHAPPAQAAMRALRRRPHTHTRAQRLQAAVPPHARPPHATMLTRRRAHAHSGAAAAALGIVVLASATPRRAVMCDAALDRRVGPALDSDAERVNGFIAGAQKGHPCRNPSI